MGDERLRTLGLNIKFARIRARISQEFLAEKIGVSRETISMIENGNQNPSVLKIIDIAKVLKIDYTDIFNEI